MKENDLVERLREEYLEGVDFDATEKDESVEMRYDDIFSYFMLALKMEDKDLMKLCLEIIERYQTSVYRVEGGEDERRATIVRYSELPEKLKKLSGGTLKDLNDLNSSFCPFYGTPEEMMAMYRSADEKEGMKNLFEGIREMIDDLSYTRSSVYGKDKEFGEGVSKYFVSWLYRFWTLFEENEEEFISSDFGSSSAFTEMVNALCDLTVNHAFENHFDILLRYLTKCVRKYGWKYDDESWIGGVINNSIWHDNYHTFSSAIYVAEKLGENYEINSYPESSLEILRDIYAHGMCLPGTEEGKKAFFNLIGKYNPTRDMITLIWDDSYFNPFFIDEMPLSVAAKNANFDSEKYRFLVVADYDLNPTEALRIPPLSYAYIRGDRKAAETLTSIGADPWISDENGNNSLHKALSLEGTKLENVVNTAPGECFFEKNNKGETPIDSYLSRKKKELLDCSHKDETRSGK